MDDVHRMKDIPTTYLAAGGKVNHHLQTEKGGVHAPTTKHVPHFDLLRPKLISNKFLHCITVSLYTTFFTRRLRLYKKSKQYFFKQLSLNQVYKKVIFIKSCKVTYKTVYFYKSIKQCVPRLKQEVDGKTLFVCSINIFL